MTERKQRKKKAMSPIPENVIPVWDVIAALLQVFTEDITCGGSYVNGPNRLMLLGLALSLQAKDILETGHNTGLTTLALALSGARVVGVDNCHEEPGVENVAMQRLQCFPNVVLMKEDALSYLIAQDDESFDLVFIDDCHWPAYTVYECQELKRVLRPGGCAVFHDTVYAELWEVIEEEFPATWQRINLPSHQPTIQFSGTESMRGLDLGIGIVRKPSPVIPHPLSRETCMAMEELPTFNLEVVTEEDERKTVHRVATEDKVIETFVAALRYGINDLSIGQMAKVNYEMMTQVLGTWGQHCSNLASHVGRIRYHKKRDKG